MTPTKDRRSDENRAVLVAMAIIIATGAVLIVGLLRLADSLGPGIGDIVAFPATRAPSVSTASMTVQEFGASARGICVLDVPVIQSTGGSLVIEAMQFKPDRSFRVHWAGVRTSKDQQDCGSSADLLLSKVQMGSLIFAAGGTGVQVQDRP